MRYPHLVTGPEYLPELRRWLVHEFRPGGRFDHLFTEYGILDVPWVKQTLSAAQLWWVDADASKVLHESCPDVPADTKLDMHDLPTTAGLAVFATPFMGKPVDPELAGMRGAFAASAETPEERRIRVDAVAWGPVKLPPLPGGGSRLAMGIASFKAYDAQRGMDAQELAEFATYVSPERGFMDAMRSGAENVTEHEEGGMTVTMRGVLYGYLGRTDWVQGDPVDTTIPDAPRQTEAALASMAEDRRLVAALWAMARTKFVRMDDAPRPPKLLRRPSERAGLDHGVRVMSLGGFRHESNGEPMQSESRDWKHQWIVSPHWRWQPYGPGRSQRRLTLIGAYRKGPEGAPLLGAERVFRLSPRKES